MFPRKLLGMLAVVPALVLPLYSQAAPLYSATFLPNGFQPNDINNAGQMAGSLITMENATHAAFYNNGLVTDLGTFGGTAGYGHRLNEAGIMTGSWSTMSEEHGFIYANGSVVDLGAGTDAYGINAHGVVVGSVVIGPGELRGFRYENGGLTILNALGTGNLGAAYDINDAGTVVGTSNLSEDFHAPFHPVSYDKHDSTPHDLGTLANYEVNGAEVINNAGQIAGYSEAMNGGEHAFLYQNNVMTDLGSLDGLFLDVGDINEQGVLVGTASSPDKDGAFIYLNGALVELSSLIDAALGWEIQVASGINDAGQIVGYGCKDFVCGGVRLDLLNPIPEPASGSMLLAGSVLLAGLTGLPGLGVLRRRRLGHYLQVVKRCVLASKAAVAV